MPIINIFTARTSDTNQVLQMNSGFTSFTAQDCMGIGASALAQLYISPYTDTCLEEFFISEPLDQQVSLLNSNVERVKDLIWASPRDLGFLVKRYEKIGTVLVLQVTSVLRVQSYLLGITVQHQVASCFFICNA
jgi:hypothetical protein